MDQHRPDGRRPEPPAPRRNNYFYGKLLDVPHLQMEQGYGIELRRMLNRLSLGAGVLCGLGVAADDGQICVLPGVAIDAQGREIIVPARACLDPWQIVDRCGRAEAERPRDVEQRVTICLAYDECLSDYMPVMVADCNARDSCAPGTIIESFRLFVRDGEPERPSGLSPEACAAIFGPDAGRGRGDFAVVATVAVGGAPGGVAVGADGRRALLLNERADGSALLQVIDIASNAVSELPADDRIRPPFGGVSVAPEGGPALVTHANGVAIVDLAAEPPAIVANLAAETAYGVCAAAFGGDTLFALNRDSGALDRIDIAAQQITQVDAPAEIVDLALAPPDSRWLYVAVAPDAPLLRIDTGTNKVANPPSISGRSARSLAVRAGAPEPEARVAYVGAIKIFGPAAPAAEVALPIDPQDSAFSSDGARYYVLSAAPNAGAELAIFESDGSRPVARVAVGARPVGLAVVPGRARALVTNSGDGTVSVVDLGPIDRRRLLCELLSGPCPPPPREPCLPLAVVTLLPGGRLGPVEACAYRPTLYSNAALLDLILCLAQRVDECCGQPQPPQPPPPPVEISIRPAELPGGRVGLAYAGPPIVASGGSAPYALAISGGAPPPGLGLAPAPGRDDAAQLSGTPTSAGTFSFTVRAFDAGGASASRPYSVTIEPREPRETLRVEGVEFINHDRQGLLKLDSPQAQMPLPAGEIAGLRVVFSRAIEPGSVTPTDFGVDPATVSFRVRASWVHDLNLPDRSVPGTIDIEAANVATFIIKEFGIFREGDYEVTLLGDDDPAGPARAISDPQGERLDGEATAAFPTGDGAPGGDFRFRFSIG